MNSLSSVSINHNNNNNNYYLTPNNNVVRIQTSAPEDTSVKTVATAGILQAIAMFLHKASEYFSSKLMQGKEFTSSENIHLTAKEMVRDNNLKVSVDYIDNNNIRQYPSQMREILSPVARGENAFYADKLKLAVAPKSKPSLILHELGHAINAGKGKLMRFLQKSRGYVSAVPTALLLANGLFARKDDKANFIEKHAGKIGFMAFLPTIIEEGLASLRGLKYAKKLKGVNLTPLKRNYFFAWMTYVIAGLGLGVAAKQALLENKKQ